MTDNTISSMTDAELDAAIAVEVMGWRRFISGVWLRDFDGIFSRAVLDWHPSTDFEKAGQVVGKMRELGFNFVLRTGFMGNTNWHAGFDNAEWADRNPLWGAQSPTAPRAICEAALMAVRANFRRCMYYMCERD